MKHRRAPLNAAGDFYVEKDMCLSCLAPKQVAPELLGHDEDTGCYFKRQPRTPEEIDHAVKAVWVSCIEAVRYGGDEPVILEKLRAKGCKSQCDESYS